MPETNFSLSRKPQTISLTGNSLSLPAIFLFFTSGFIFVAAQSQNAREPLLLVAAIQRAYTAHHRRMA